MLSETPPLPLQHDLERTFRTACTPLRLLFLASLRHR